MKRKKTDKVLLEQYRDPENPGSYGGVERFVKDNRISIKHAKQILQKYLGYTLNKPRRRRFPTLVLLVFNIDQQHALKCSNMERQCSKTTEFQLNVPDKF